MFTLYSISSIAACYCCLVAKSCTTLRPHGLQHTRLPCPSLSLRVCSNSCPLSQWCHPTISSSAAPFSSSPSIFSRIRVFSIELALQIRPSASPSVLPMNIRGWFPLGLTGLISLLSKGLSRVFSSTTIRKHQFFGAQPCLWSSSHVDAWLMEKP